ncbi:hypothetical protein N0V90_004604 [Kalmusia sp. IMI 367209]|nr:hypothetical protein N0V90_004604 [Kalmusia sp. IMI 367209]
MKAFIRSTRRGISAKRARKSQPYETINSADQEIRLLELLPGNFWDRIELHLSRARLIDKPEYEALSYAWGRELHDEEQAIVNGTFFTLTDNLDCALRYLRSSSARRSLWVDALCINQLDTHERNLQVQMMGLIYSNASNVIIWLHPIDPGGVDSMAFNCINRDTVPDNGHNGTTDGGYHKKPDEIFDESRLVLALIDICQCTWFSRLWIVQELTLATRDPIIHCGFDTTSWTQFCGYIMRMRRAVTRPERLSIAYERAKVIAKTTAPKYSAIQSGSVVGERLLLLGLSERIEYLYEVRRSGRHANFAVQLYRTGPFEATDPRDKVFGLLGISSFSTTPIVPDYSKLVEQVFCEAMASVLRENFSYAYTLLPLLPLPSRAQNAVSVPSWLIHQAHLDTRIVLEALLGYLDKETLKEYHNLHRTFIRLLEHDDNIAALNQEDPSYQRLNDILVRTAHRRTLFVTDTGRVGLSYHPDIKYGIRNGDIVTGLFGINFPFILRATPGETSLTMVNVAHVAAHEWHKVSVECAAEITDSRSLQSRGLTEYIIV